MENLFIMENFFIINNNNKEVKLKFLPIDQIQYLKSQRKLGIHFQMIHWSHMTGLFV